MAKNIKRAALKAKRRMNESRRALRTSPGDTQSNATTVSVCNEARLYAIQKALYPDRPNLSPNEIDDLKAVLGF